MENKGNYIQAIIFVNVFHACQGEFNESRKILKSSIVTENYSGPSQTSEMELFCENS